MKGKTKSILVLLATLVIGMILGGMIAGHIFHSRVAHMRAMREGGKFTSHLIELATPSPEQRTAITPILDGYGKRMEMMHQRHIQEIVENHKLLREQLSQHLDSSQMKTLNRELHRMIGRFRRDKRHLHKKNHRQRE
ncbi:MAG TPA: hypothetical protein ENJ82_10410 [Bacteroidetes bacterium]|nr:hypothetical protein [Bacteroidota bacterium]